MTVLLTSSLQACKCISIGLLEPDDGFENEPKIVPPLWFPDIPRDFQFSSQALGQDTCEEEPKYYLNMDFGGPQGERLSLLSRITPFLNGQGLLMGMAFFYDDGTELVFGFRWAFHSLLSATICPEPSIEIRGSAGERIIRVYCEADAKHQPPRPRFQVRHPRLLGFHQCVEVGKLIAAATRLRRTWLLNPHLGCIIGVVRSQKDRSLLALKVI